ncbi:MAG: biotin--[acetyl-CoA-carboxylase] ligase [Pseudomonadota bacterium]
MSSNGWPAGVGRIALGRVESTMAEAAARAGDLAAPTWIMAAEQVAARGRRGRAWATPPGNFAATFVMRPEGGPAEAALRSFVAALALHDALVALTGRPEMFALKWPNDVLLNGGKLAGILLESVGHGALLVGVGVNLIEAPAAEDLEPGALRPVALAAETGVHVAQADFLDHLAVAFAHWEGQMACYGFAPIRTAWLARAARLGEEITARTGVEEVTGRFEDVDPGGHLVLASAGGRRIIAAAEIFFP